MKKQAYKPDAKPTCSAQAWLFLA